mgnify:CR=1 FL=1
MTSARHINNVINGQSRPASDGATSDIINPSTGEVYAAAPVSTSADVDAAFAAAKDAFAVWRDVTPGVRQKALLDIADMFEKHAEELVEIESENTGKPVAVTISEEIDRKSTRLNSSHT